MILGAIGRLRVFQENKHLRAKSCYLHLFFLARNRRMQIYSELFFFSSCILSRDDIFSSKWQFLFAYLTMLLHNQLLVHLIVLLESRRHCCPHISQTLAVLTTRLLNGWALFVYANFRIRFLAMTRFQRIVWCIWLGDGQNLFCSDIIFIIKRFLIARGLSRTQVPLYSGTDWMRRSCRVRTPKMLVWRKFIRHFVGSMHKFTSRCCA